MRKFHASKGMGVLEKMSENLESTEAKRDSLRKSIMMVMLDCRDFEKHLETSQKCLIECLSELESREKHLDSVRDSLSQNFEELGLKVKEVEDKEKDLILLQQKGMEELELKEKEWALKKEEFDEEFRKREVKLSEKEKAAEGLFGKLENEKNETVALEILMEERLRELWLKEEGLEQWSKEIEKRESELDEREKNVMECEKRVGSEELAAMRVEREREIEMKEKEVRLMREDLEFKEKAIEFERAVNEKRQKELEIREKQLEEREKQYEITQKCLHEVHLKEKECLLEKELLQKGSKELEVKRKELEDRIKGIKELEMREKQLEKKEEEVEVRERQLKRKREEVEVMEKQLGKKKKEEYQLEKELLEKGNRELELKKKEFEDRIKEYDLREKELELKEEKLADKLHACLKTNPVETVVDERAISNSTSRQFTFAVELDQLDIRMFLNEREVNLESPDEVFKDLQSSGDPVYFVLTAVEALYPPYLRKVDMVFEGRVASCCILLLEQLLRLSPQIQPSAKSGALKLASEWKAIIETGNVLEVLGFLYLLASFDLASAFDVKEVMNFLEIVAQNQKTPELCRLLGLTDKIPGFIMDLTKKKRYLLAFEYVYEFNLVDKIPPIALVKKHVSHSKQVAKTLCNEGQNTPEAQIKALVNEISALKSAIKSIIDRGLEREYSPNQLRQRVIQLESRRANLKTSLSAPISEELPKLDPSKELSSAQKAEVKEKDNEKPPLSDDAIINEARLPSQNKSRRLALPETTHNFQLANGQNFHSV
ncbi:FRIGIDA-like protein 3 [Coffea eugenioides]|uniref:FRIGIDA-like protein 3 n=1 Tax=Coffea eugenioides TaxID=49369 RepID=UPI000F607B7B|nr:FRIGIDA-like protein 3 [Coffea eugenioides]